MTWLKTIVEETVSLFIDDGRFALAIIVWPALLWLLVTFAKLTPLLAAPGLFVGLICVLAEAAVRRARS